jgi:hypothetical protein
MLPTLFRSLLVLVLLGALAHAEAAGRRVALVIGNSAYVSVPELDNPSNDAKAVARQLRDLGFEVTLLLDLDKASFEAKVRDFVGSLSGAEAALFFGVFGPEVWSAVGDVQTLPFAPTPGGMVPTKRWDPQSIPVNAPMPQ